MSSPLLFFIFIIVIDLVLKSSKDKKKIEEAKQKREQELQGRPDLNKQKPIQKPESIRGMMSTLREEIEKERQKEIERRQVKTRQTQEVRVNRVNMEEKKITQKTYEDNEYWEKKRKEDYNKKKEMVVESRIEINERNMREDIIRGIIFSEILSEPKSIQNQKRSM